MNRIACFMAYPDARAFADDFLRHVDIVRANYRAVFAHVPDLPGAEDTGAFIASALSASASEAKARGAVGRLALLTAAAAMRQSSPAAVTDVFARTRLASQHGALFGASEIPAANARTVLQRALPA